MKRCFVLGNGISLQTHDLELMSEDVTLACNKIHMLYYRTSWRPTYWFSIDRTSYQTTIAEYLMHFQQEYQCYVADDWFGFHNGQVDVRAWPNVEALKTCDEPHETAPPWNHVARDHEACRFGGTGYIAIQWAHRVLKCDLVYLIGFDGNYDGDASTNHFDPNYGIQGAMSEGRAEEFNAELELAHAQASREAAQRSLQIYNAGRVHLKHYPHVKYEELFDGGS